MKYVGIYWTVFAPLMKKSLPVSYAERRFHIRS